MKGYLSFVLVLFAFSILLVLLQSNQTSKIDITRMIALDKLEQTNMNIKESVIETARQSSRNAFNEYVSAKVETKQKPDKNELELFIKIRVHESLASLQTHSFDPSIKSDLWCGSINDNGINALLEKIKNEKTIGRCSSCMPIESYSCMDYINVNLAEENQVPILESLTLGSDFPAHQGIGITVYSEEYDMALVGYIPASEVIEP